MRIVVAVCYVLVALAVCSFLLTSAVLIAGIVSPKPDHSDGMAAFGDLLGVVLLFMSFAVHAFFATLCIATAAITRARIRKQITLA